jgi:branched-chain amino acid transport system substrate-binding protein
MKRILIGTAALVVLSAVPTVAQEPVKIGFVNTFSGPAAVIGNDARNSFKLAPDHLGRKMAGRPVEVIYEDDQQKPEVGKQKTEKLIQSDKVDFVVVYNWSNVLLASLKPAVDSKTFLISANAGPHQIAGELCSPYFFSTSWQNNQTPEAMSLYINQRNVKTLYMLGPNYAAGKDMLAGVASTFKGKIIGQEFTQWPGQLDFSAELTKVKAAKPDAVFVFYPGAAGVQFLNQYAQAGLKGTIPLNTVFTIDALSLPRQGDLALSVPGVQEWVNDLPNEATKKFVADFKVKHKTYLSLYGAQSCDAANLINSAVVAVKGDLSKKGEMRKEMRKANYASVRGPYKYGNNQFPIQNFYLQDVVLNRGRGTTISKHQNWNEDEADQARNANQIADPQATVSPGRDTVSATNSVQVVNRVAEIRDLDVTDVRVSNDGNKILAHREVPSGRWWKLKRVT